MPPGFSWIMDKRAEVESEESLELEALRKRRRSRVGSGVMVEDDGRSMHRQGLKYDCRMRKSEGGAGGGCLERAGSVLFLPDAIHRGSGK
jgi:hypothetical protein